MLTTIVAAIVVLGLLIFVHELGHFLVAKWCGVRVIRFSIGFGPNLLAKTVGETEYTLKAIPLGGYVKMLGEGGDPDEEDEEGIPADPDRSFALQPLRKRFAIVFAGPFFNIASAWLFIVAALLLYGAAEATSDARIGSLSEGLPAEAAGLEENDLVRRVGDVEIAGWEHFAETIREQRDEVVLEVERDGRVLQVPVTPEKIDITNVFGEKTGEGYRIGAGPAIERVDVPLWEVPVVATVQVGTYSGLIVMSVVKMVQGRVSARELGGPITIARVAGERARSGLEGLLAFMAFLGINLGILNLLPIPVLDGGHLFFFGIEAIVGRPIEGRFREIAQQAGLVLLIAIMLFAVFNDISRWVQG